MHVLVTRPQLDAERTAERLRARGDVAVLSPVTRIVPIEAPPQPGTFDAVLATSANAFRYADADVLAASRPLPTFVVGIRTATAARDAGFAQVTVAGGDVEGLVWRVALGLRPGARLLYLAGQPRKQELETRFAAAGFRVVPHVCYGAEAVAQLTDAAETQLHGGKIDAVLHYSRESAARFSELALGAGLRAACGQVQHLCLSHDVAQGLNPLAAPRILIAEMPDEAALFMLLDKDH